MPVLLGLEESGKSMMGLDLPGGSTNQFFTHSVIEKFVTWSQYLTRRTGPVSNFNSITLGKTMEIDTA